MFKKKTENPPAPAATPASIVEGQTAAVPATKNRRDQREYVRNIVHKLIREYIGLTSIQDRYTLIADLNTSPADRGEIRLAINTALDIEMTRPAFGRCHTVGDIVKLAAQLVRAKTHPHLQR